MKKTVILLDGRRVLKKHYVEAKTKILIEFGYIDLKESEVSEQLEKVLKKEKLSVIGLFIEDDIII